MIIHFHTFFNFFLVFCVALALYYSLKEFSEANLNSSFWQNALTTLDSCNIQHRRYSEYYNIIKAIVDKDIEFRAKNDKVCCFILNNYNFNNFISYLQH